MMTTTLSPKFELTLDAVKGCIGFPKGSNMHTALSGMVDCWYAIQKGKGATEAEAVKYAFDQLGDKVLEMSRKSISSPAK
jgi:hypothetical protein